MPTSRYAEKTKRIKHENRKRKAPYWLLMGFAISLLINTAAAITTPILVLQHSNDLNKIAQLTTKYQNAAVIVSKVAIPLTHDVTLICEHDHLACLTILPKGSHK